MSDDPSSGGTRPGASSTVGLPCPYCRAITGPAGRDAVDWGCPRCQREWVFRRCRSCHDASHVGAVLPRGGPWTCVWCGSVNSGFRPRRDPAERTASNVADSAERRHLEFAWPPLAPPRLAPEQRARRPGLIVTTNEVPGHRILAVHGDVIGVTARSTSFIGTWLSNLRTIGGGDQPELARLLLAARELARDRMWAEAVALGANAVVATRFDCNELQDVIVEVAAYGTAVTVETGGSGVVVALLEGIVPLLDATEGADAPAVGRTDVDTPPEVDAG